MNCDGCKMHWRNRWLGTTCSYPAPSHAPQWWAVLQALSPADGGPALDNPLTECFPLHVLSEVEALWPSPGCVLLTLPPFLRGHCLPFVSPLHPGQCPRCCLPLGRGNNVTGTSGAWLLAVYSRHSPHAAQLGVRDSPLPAPTLLQPPSCYPGHVLHKVQCSIVPLY